MLGATRFTIFFVISIGLHDQIGQFTFQFSLSISFKE